MFKRIVSGGEAGIVSTITGNTRRGTMLDLYNSKAFEPLHTPGLIYGKELTGEQISMSVLSEYLGRAVTVEGFIKEIFFRDIKSSHLLIVLQIGKQISLSGVIVYDHFEEMYMNCITAIKARAYDNDDPESVLQNLRPSFVDPVINMTEKRRVRENRLMFAGAGIGSIMAITIGFKVGGIIGVLTGGLLLIPLSLLGMLIGFELFFFTEPEDD
ncbi:MAG: hypothetical protein IJ820_03365 [Lachnospiraceae bacterium]|nr:hypothetical protein [Lachnospiraceae bacterium]